MKLVLASANPDKARELAQILAAELGDRIEIVPRPDDVPDVDETGATLEANALLKAKAVCDATALPALADDSGLEVDALDGAPGVYSARYSGPAATYESNVTKLLRELGDAADRRARFRTVVAVVFPDGRELLAEGVVHGAIAHQPRGERGFGYDPVFVPDDDPAARTFAEMSDDEKHAISHRGRSIRAAAAKLAPLT